MTDEQNQQQVLRITDQILKRLGPQSDFDPTVGVAALAIAMCSLARSSGISRSDIDKLLSIVENSIAETNPN